MLISLYKNNIPIPDTARQVPIVAGMVTFSLNMIMAGGMISTGTMDIMVAAMPVLVYWIAINERETPRKGPKKEPMLSWVMAALLWKAFITGLHQPIMVYNRIKPPSPAMDLI